MKEINFDVDLSANELYSFMMRHTYTNISGIFGVIISLGSLVICALRYKYLDNTAIIALIIIGFMFTVIQPIMLYSKARAQVKKNKNINAKLHYIINESGITVVQGEQKAEVKWYEIRKKVVAGKAVYLYMSPVRAFIFPKAQCGECFEAMIKMIDGQMKKYKDYEPNIELSKDLENCKHEDMNNE